MNIELIWYFTHENTKCQFIEQINNRFGCIDPLMFIDNHIMFMNAKLKQELSSDLYKYIEYSLETFYIDPKADTFNSSDENDFNELKHSDMHYQHVINCNSIGEFISAIKFATHK